MRLRSRRGAGRAVLACAVLGAVLCACGAESKTDVTTVNLAAGAIPTGPVGVADPAPTFLAEPVLTGNAKLFARTVQIQTLCSGFPQLTGLKQPRAGDLEGQYEYAGVYYNVLTTIDPDRQIVDKQASTRSSRKRSLPDEVKAALATERREMYAYLVRLGYARDLRDQSRNTPAELATRVRDAFRKLAEGPYAEADITLVRYEVDHCA